MVEPHITPDAAPATQPPERQTAINALLYLAGCALHGTPPQQQGIHGVDRETLYRVASFHSMAAIAGMALESGGFLAGNDPETAQKWKDATNKAIRKNMLLDAERQKLFIWMEAQGCWYMPLKGSVLKDLYPRLGMRQMADNDILIDPAFEFEAEKYMISQGYEALFVGKSNHDVYRKAPIYNFELHTALFGAPHKTEWIDYYREIKQRLIPDDEAGCGCHFTDEDFYVYLTAHACKHYSGSGTGLRSLMDSYVYLWRKGAALDWAYIEAETEKLGIATFEKDCRSLCHKVFAEPAVWLSGGPTLSPAEAEMLAYFAGSGTYGTVQHRVEKKLQELQPGEKEITAKTRLRYCLRRIFPDGEWFRQFHPFFYRHIWARPAFMVCRVFHGLFKRSKAISREWAAIWHG